MLITPTSIGTIQTPFTSLEGLNLHIEGVDVLDGTPLLDIKPWVPTFDVRKNVRTGWRDKNQEAS